MRVEQDVLVLDVGEVNEAIRGRQLAQRLVCRRSKLMACLLVASSGIQPSVYQGSSPSSVSPTMIEAANPIVQRVGVIAPEPTDGNPNGSISRRSSRAAAASANRARPARWTAPAPGTG
jgi:hypothetical protein